MQSLKKKVVWLFEKEELQKEIFVQGGVPSKKKYTLTLCLQVPARNTVNTKPRLGECYTCFACETKTGVVRT